MADINRLSVNARIPATLHKEMKVWCAQHDEKIQDFVTNAINTYLKFVRERSEKAEQGEKGEKGVA